jgi:hypothetical protein
MSKSCPGRSVAPVAKRRTVAQTSADANAEISEDKAQASDERC